VTLEVEGVRLFRSEAAQHWALRRKLMNTPRMLIIALSSRSLARVVRPGPRVLGTGL
jgi:hypothetical protein